MWFKDIKERRVYYVDFSPVKFGEFPTNSKLHLAIVLKKNNDKNTVVVVPLTGNESGLGKNKECILINSLPKRLKGKKSYIVKDQIRTLNVERINKIYDNNNEVDVFIEDELYLKVIKFIQEEVSKKITLDEKIEVYKDKLSELYKLKLVELAYIVKRGENIESIRTKIEGILYNDIEYKFTDKEKEDGIENIINSIKEKNLEVG